MTSEKRLSVKVDDENASTGSGDDLPITNDGSSTGTNNSKEQWKAILRVGGESVYCFLQTSYVIPEGWIIGIATVLFQMYCFYVFIEEAIVCGIKADTDRCNLATGGLLQTAEDGSVTVSLTGNDDATALGLITGITVAAMFLLPDFMKGFVFLKMGYVVVGFVHIIMCFVAITASALYCATTAASDVSILTNIVVLLFITELDEKMFALTSFARDIFVNALLTDD